MPHKGFAVAILRRMDERQPLEIIRDLNRRWATRDFETMREALLGADSWDDAVRRFEEAGLPVDPIDPDVEVIVDAFPGGGAWIGQRGRDQWIRFWQTWVRPWRNFELEDAYYEQVGDHVLVEVRVSARTRDRGELVELPVVQLFNLRGGLVCMYGVYPNRDDALAAITSD
jgi:hypothetical protein